MPFLGVLRFCASNDIRKGGKMSKWDGFVVRFLEGKWEIFGAGSGMWKNLDATNYGK